MSLPRDYSKALHKQAGFYASWFPVTMPFGIGDYGLIQNGVFNKIGNLDDLRADGFNIQIKPARGTPTSIDFLSEGARTIKTIAGVEVPTSLPATGAEAKITYEFDKKNSFVVKASEINVERMENVREVADELARLRRQNNWSHSYRVVSATYTGQNCLVLLSSEAGTKVEFVAAASALQQLDLGNVEIRPSVSFSSNTILRSIGNTGPIGLSMFKLTRFFGNLKVLAEAPLTDEEQKMEEDWGDELEDDDL